MMEYNEFAKVFNETLRNLREWYGDFGITYKVIWNGNVIADVEVGWAQVNNCSLDSVHRFTEALNAATYEAARFIGVYVED